MRAALVLVTASLVVMALGLEHRHPAAAAATKTGNRTFVAALPEIGAVYARYDCRHGRRFALGIRMPWKTQTTSVRFRAGSFTRDRTLQPGDPTSWFRFTAQRVQWLAAAAGGENGTVVGWVRVVGYPRHSRGDCAPYAPPRATVQTYPRNYVSPSFSLRKLIG